MSTEYRAAIVWGVALDEDVEIRDEDVRAFRKAHPDLNVDFHVQYGSCHNDAWRRIVTVKMGLNCQYDPVVVNLPEVPANAQETLNKALEAIGQPKAQGNWLLFWYSY